MDSTIPAVLAHAAHAYGDAEALVESGGPRLSYRDLHDRNFVHDASVLVAVELREDTRTVEQPEFHGPDDTWPFRANT